MQKKISFENEFSEEGEVRAEVLGGKCTMGGGGGGESDSGGKIQGGL